MPSILTLQGPNLSLLGLLPAGDPVLLGSFANAADTAKAHPIVLIGGLLFGGWLASKYAPAWGATWGGQHATQARERALQGPKRRRRK